MATPKPQISFQDIVKQEYVKCAASPVYFMRHYVKIQHPIRGMINFDLFKFQEETLQSFAEFKFNIILKSRQMGISTLVSAFSLWTMIFHKDKNILIISLKQEDAKDIITKVRYAHDNLPTWLKIKCIEDNRLSLKFSNGSQIKAASTTKKSGVGQALSLLIIDECALIEEAEELWTSALPTLSTGGNSIILSCVTKDTMVITNKGIQEIGDFIDVSKSSGYEINEYSILGVNKIRGGNLFYNNGLQKTNIIKTKFSELECTLNHKLWAYKNNTKSYGWFKSEELEVGDFISLQYGKQVWGNNDDICEFRPSVSPKIHSPFSPKILTPDLCYLFGLYISEGSTYKVLNKNNNLIGGSITITCGDNISNIFDTLGLTYNCWDGIHYNVSNKNLIELMEFVGFDLSNHACKKCIPRRLLQMSRECIRAMLMGIFDGDGCATNKVIKLTSTSRKLINQTRMLLSNFGILSSITYESKEKCNSRNNKIRHNNDVFNIEINGRHTLGFYNSIGFRLSRKQQKKNNLSLSNFSRAISMDVIPNSLGLVQQLVKLSDASFSDIAKNHGIIVNSYCNSRTNYKTNHISRQNVILLYSLFSEKLQPEELEFWSHILHDNIVWCPITSIESSENETFDFSLPDNSSDFWCHSIIYNGVIGHQTPRGVGNFFHRMWQGAEESNDGKIGSNGFHPIKLPWELHPERNEEWRRIEGGKLGNPKKASQEFDCDFLASGDNVIDLIIIEFYKKTYQKDPIDKRGVDHGLWVWQYPDYSHSYIVSADCARGDGADFSAAHVLDITGEMPTQVAEYKGTLGTKDFGHFLVALATEYNTALLIIERENVGWGTLQAVIDREYTNTFYSSADLKYVDVQRQLTNRYDSEEKKLVPGFSTNMKTRPLIINNIDMYFREKAVMIHSKRTFAELDTFIWKNGKAQAMEPYNDDLIMSLAIGLWVRDTALRLRQEGIDLTRSALGQMNMTKGKDIPIYRQAQVKSGMKSWQMNTGRQGYGNQNIEDLKWLIS